MSDELKDRRVHVPLSTRELARLDNWRAREQIWSRADAIRRLVAEGLDRADAKAKKAPGAGKPTAKKAPAKRKARTLMRD